MYAIYTTIKREPFYIDDESGEKIKQKLESGKLETFVKVGDQATIPKTTIRGVEVNAKKDIEELRDVAKQKEMSNGTQMAKAVAEEYALWHRAQRMKSPEFLGKNTRLAEMVWQSHTGEKTIPEDIKAKIIERQIEYLKQNKGRVYASPIAYRDLVEKYRDSNTEKSGLRNIASVLPRVGMSLVESCIASDVREAKYARETA
jgi:hypothetical protein